MKRRLRVGVPAHLLELEPAGGHGKVWHRVLTALRRSVRLMEICEAGGRLRLMAPDVILASGHDRLLPTSAPLVVQVHDIGWFEPELRAALDPQFLSQIAPKTELAVRSAARIITPSEAARRDLVDAYGLPGDRVHAVHHGVDPLFRPGLDGGRQLVARARGGPEAPYVLYAAIIHPRKNLDALRKAMATLAREGHPQVLAVAGRPAPDRPDSSELERAAAAELPEAPGKIAFLGQPSDQELGALMAGADAFCLPSLYEGFGMTALEAMACGAPVVVSDRGALPEIVGEAGIVVQPTAEAVAAGLREILANRSRASALGTEAAARARRFSWERTAAGWLEVLRIAAYTRAR